MKIDLTTDTIDSMIDFSDDTEKDINPFINSYYNFDYESINSQYLNVEKTFDSIFIKQTFIPHNETITESDGESRSDEKLNSTSSNVQTDQKGKKRKSPFYILTERKLKADAIYKKINRSFYNWVIYYLNTLSLSCIRFTKLSKVLIKTITKNEVRLNLNEKLINILLTDRGCDRFNKEFLNKEQINKMYTNLKGNQCFSEVNAFLNLNLEKIYKIYLNHTKEETLKGFAVNEYRENYKFSRTIISIIISGLALDNDLILNNEIL